MHRSSILLIASWGSVFSQIVCHFTLDDVIGMVIDDNITPGRPAVIYFLRSLQLSCVIGK